MKKQVQKVLREQQKNQNPIMPSRMGDKARQAGMKNQKKPKQNSKKNG
jgi:hypothetical protein